MQESNLGAELYDPSKYEKTATPPNLAMGINTPSRVAKLNADGTVQKSKRRHAPKVRTGCLTCKKRRVKCDEAKPHCKRCLSSRTVCDGYAKPIPPKAPRVLVQRELSSAAVLSPSASKVLCRNETELRYLQLYKTEIAPKIGGSFPSKFWDVILLQESQEDVAVLGMILAITARINSRKAMQNGDHAIANEHTDFASKQHQRSINGLALSQSAAEKSIRKAVISYLLVTCYEAVAGNVLACLGYAQAGHDHLQNWLASNPYPNQTRVGISSPAPQIIEHDLIQAAFFFDLQLLQHFDSRSATIHGQLKHEGNETVERMPHNFTDVDEARAYWMLLQRRASHFVWEATALVTSNEVSGYESSSSMAAGGSPPMARTAGDSEMQRSTSLPVPFSNSSSPYRPTSATHAGQSASNFDEQDAGLQLLELATLDSSQQGGYLHAVGSSTSQNALFNPMFSFFGAPGVIASTDIPNPHHLAPTSSSQNPRVMSTPSFTPTRSSASISTQSSLDVLAGHQMYASENLRWRLSFSHLYSRLRKSSNPSLIIAANVLFIQSIAAEIQLSTILSLAENTTPSDHRNSTSSSRNLSVSSTGTNPPPILSATAPLNDYREIVNTSRAVVEAKSKLAAEDGIHTGFTFDLGITQALYTVIQHCPNKQLAKEALDILRRYDCKEGAWDCLGLVDGGEGESGLGAW